jgi:hypothetical protein
MESGLPTREEDEAEEMECLDAANEELETEDRLEDPGVCPRTITARRNFASELSTVADGGSVVEDSIGSSASSAEANGAVTLLNNLPTPSRMTAALAKLMLPPPAEEPGTVF